MNIAANNWERVNVQNLESFLQTFKLHSKIKKQEYFSSSSSYTITRFFRLAGVINWMITEQRYQEATSIINDYNLQEFMDMKAVLHTLLENNKVLEAERLSAENIDYQKVRIDNEAS